METAHGPSTLDVDDEDISAARDVAARAGHHLPDDLIAGMVQAATLARAFQIDITRTVCEHGDSYPKFMLGQSLHDLASAAVAAGTGIITVPTHAVMAASGREGHAFLEGCRTFTTSALVRPLHVLRVP